MCSVKLFFYAKTSNLAAAMTIVMSRALQRCVVSTGSRVLGPQHQAPRASASHCTRALHVCSETFFFYAKTSNLAAATALSMSRALQRCVVSTGSRVLGPQHQAPRASASHCTRALHVCSETFFFYAKTSNLAAATTLSMSRALQRAVGSTRRVHIGPEAHAVVTRSKRSYIVFAWTSKLCITNPQKFGCEANVDYGRLFLF